MNNLPIWIAVWNASNTASSGAELTSTESIVVVVIMLAITLALAGYVFYDLRRY